MTVINYIKEKCVSMQEKWEKNTMVVIIGAVLVLILIGVLSAD